MATTGDVSRTVRLRAIGVGYRVHVFDTSGAETHTRTFNRLRDARTWAKLEARAWRALFVDETDSEVDGDPPKLMYAVHPDWLGSEKPKLLKAHVSSWGPVNVGFTVEGMGNRYQTMKRQHFEARYSPTVTGAWEKRLEAVVGDLEWVKTRLANAQRVTKLTRQALADAKRAEKEVAK